MSSVSPRPEGHQPPPLQPWNRPRVLRWIAAGSLASFLLFSVFSTVSAFLEIQKENQIRQWVESIGGFCRTTRHPRKDHWLKRLLDSPSVTMVGIESGSPYLDRDMLTRLPGLSHLSELHLEVSDLIDDDLETLSGCRKIRVLNLSRSSVEGSGFVHMTGMKFLEEIHLGGCRLTARHLAILNEVPNLKKLDLSGAVLIGEDDIRLENLFPQITLILPSPHSDQSSE